MAKKGTQLNVRVPETLYWAVQARASRRGISQSEIVRDALIRYLVDPRIRGAGPDKKGADLQVKKRATGGHPPGEE